LVIDKHRHQQRRPAGDLQDAEALPAPSYDTPERQMMAKEQYQMLWKTLETLSDQQRAMVILRYLVGWRVKEIAQHLQLPENTVTVTLPRVLTKLSQQQE